MLGAQALPWLRARLGLDVLVSGGSRGGAANLVVLGAVDGVAVAVASLVVAGAGWIAVLSSLNTSAQLAAPVAVRGRALSINQLVFAAGMAGGSALWGVVAEAAGLTEALIVAAATWPSRWSWLVAGRWRACCPAPPNRRTRRASGCDAGCAARGGSDGGPAS